ncbi:MAG: hypothetical protein FJ271_16080 [Planctomycetes bacterium]|nr:hypothetical protein [Planctomycetota bacterium]
MNDDRRQIAILRAAVLCAAVLFATAAACLAASLVAGAGQQKRKLTPFLDEFKSITDPEIVTRAVLLPGDVPGYLARPDTREKLPAVLLVGGGDGRDDWYRLSARELSSIGYVVVAVNEHGVDKLRAAIGWLRKRPDVLAERIGLLGWGPGGAAALRLAMDTPVQACVTCDGFVPEGDVATLKSPVLGVFSRSDAARGKQIDVFRAALARRPVATKVYQFVGVKEGFMGPPGSAAYSNNEAEEAWLQIYEFLGKHVEDAKDGNGKEGASPTAGIADIMRAVNAPTGLRGLLIRSLEKEPRDDAGWKQTRALAVMIAEGAGILERLAPPRGDKMHWREQTGSFRTAAERIVNHADRRDFQGVRQALELLGNRCAACHKQHR